MDCRSLLMLKLDKKQSEYCNWFIDFKGIVERVVSHIQDFGDAATSLAGDAASLLRDAAPTLGRCGHLSLEM